MTGGQWKRVRGQMWNRREQGCRGKKGWGWDRVNTGEGR